MPRRSFFVLAALIGLGSVAGAADIQVSYRVDAKLLKKNTPAGTSLAFQLFTDSTCATSAGSPQNANVEAVTLIEQPKLIKVKGGPTPPSVAEIRYTLTGVTPKPAFYAIVTGTGITPVGGTCQLQPGGPRLPIAVARDAVGAFVGTVGLVPDFAPSRTVILIDDPAGTLAFAISSKGELNDYAIFYTENADCSGARFLQPGQGNPGPGGVKVALTSVKKLWVQTSPDQTATVNGVLSESASVNSAADCGSATFVPPHGCCGPVGPATGSFPPATAVRDLSGFTFPLRVSLE